MAQMIQNGAGFGPALSDALLGEQVSSGNVGRTLTGSELTGMDSGGVSFPDTDPLTMSTSQKPTEMIVGMNKALPATGSSAGGAAGTTQAQTDVLKSSAGKELTPSQQVGMSVVSGAFDLMAHRQNLKEKERAAIHQINNEWQNFDFANRLNRTAQMVSETRGLLASIKNINRQVARGDDQQFISSPTTGSLI